jgi:hypothetical protein
MPNITQQERQQLLLQLASSRDVSSAAAALEALLPRSALGNEWDREEEEWLNIEAVQSLLAADEQLAAQLITPLISVLQHQQQEQQQQEDDDTQQQQQQQQQSLGDVAYPESGRWTTAAQDLLQSIAFTAYRSHEAAMVQQVQEQLQPHVEWLLRAACSNSRLAYAAAIVAGCVARPAALPAAAAHQGSIPEEVRLQSFS